MNTYVVWIELNQARVFKVEPKGTQRQVLKRHEMKHHTSRDPENHKNAESFFHQVAEVIRDADEIFLVGPGLAKDHFQSHLKRHHHESLALRVLGSQALDHSSDAQILEASREFFRKFDLFGQAMPA